MRVDGRDVLLFAGSNYLDLAHHPEVVEAVGARRARLRLRGRRLAADQRQPRAARGARGGARRVPRHRGRARLRDRLHGERRRDPGARRPRATRSSPTRSCHASIIDGCRLSRAAVRVFAHGDARRARGDARASAAREHRRVLVALDGVYSMDGDLAPLAALVAAREAPRRDRAARRRARHRRARRERAAARAELLGVEGEASTCCVGTLGKALGSFGAFVAGARALRELLVNTARQLHLLLRARAAAGRGRARRARACVRARAVASRAPRRRTRRGCARGSPRAASRPRRAPPTSCRS